MIWLNIFCELMCFSLKCKYLCHNVFLLINIS
nr:MAG TPA: hypothetical protein [Caudoviricetes sp.]